MIDLYSEQKISLAAKSIEIQGIDDRCVHAPGGQVVLKIFSHFEILILGAQECPSLDQLWAGFEKHVFPSHSQAPVSDDILISSSDCILSLDRNLSEITKVEPVHGEPSWTIRVLAKSFALARLE